MHLLGFSDRRQRAWERLIAECRDALRKHGLELVIFECRVADYVAYIREAASKPTFGFEDSRVQRRELECLHHHVTVYIAQEQRSVLSFDMEQHVSCSNY